MGVHCHDGKSPHLEKHIEKPHAKWPFSSFRVEVAYFLASNMREAPHGYERINE
jgi:hypothetical protein